MMLKVQVSEIAYQKHITQNDMVRLTGISRNSVGKYWHNKITRIDVNVLKKFADVLHVKIDDLLIEEDAPQAVDNT